MHVLFVAGWSDPFGDFIKEHAYAAAAHCKISYVYLEFIKTGKHLPYKITKENYLKNNVQHHVIKIHCPLRRFGVYELLIKNNLNALVKELNAITPIDLCHINVLTPVTELVTELWSLKNVPKVVTEHSSFYQYGIYSRFNGKALTAEKNRIKKWFLQPAIKFVLPVSNQLGKVLSDNYAVAPAKIVKVPDVTAPEFFYVPKPKEHQVNILLVAIWNAPKNPLLFVKAIRLLEPSLSEKLSIDWIGEGEQLQEVKEFIERELKGTKINFHGLVLDRKKMASFYQKAHFLVHPTDSETLSVVIIEALCCGTPVVSNAIDGVLELVDDSNGLLSPIRDEKALAQNIELMVKTHKNYDSEKIAASALGQFGHGPVGEKIFGIYEKAVNSK